MRNRERITLGLLIGCGWAVKRKIRNVMLFSHALMLSAMAYILYKMTRFSVGPHAYNYTTPRGTLTFFCAYPPRFLSTLLPPCFRNNQQ